MLLKVTPLSHVKAVSFSLWVLPLIIGGGFILAGRINSLWVGIAFYGVFLLPSLYLHLQYYMKNRGQIIQIFENELVVRNDGKAEEIIKFSDIKKITLCKSASIDKGGIQMTPLESYHFARLMLKNGESLFITNLIAPDVERAISLIKWVPYERHKGLFLHLGFADKPGF